MTTEILHPKNEQDWLSMRKKDVTSTEVSALFGCSPYLTAFELWHRKQGNMDVAIEQNERMKWGTRLQDSIAAGIAEDQGWQIRRMTEYMRDTELKLGASFDFAFCKHKTDGLGSAIEGKDEEDGILEVKNVDGLAFRDGWIVDGANVEAPPHIEIQVQVQLAVSGKKSARIGALIGGNRVVLIEREPDFGVITQIKECVRDFWISVMGGIAPAPDFQRDAAFISKLYGYAEPGSIITAHGNPRILSLALQYKEAGVKEKAAKLSKDAAKAQILTLIGPAEKVMGDGFTISSGMIGPKHIEYDAAGYRNWKINWKKEK